VQEQVGWLQIAVHHLVSVQIGKSLQYFLNYRIITLKKPIASLSVRYCRRWMYWARLSPLQYSQTM
jgi:hypothetical protein